MRTLKEEILYNSGLSNKTRAALATWMENIETALAEHKDAIDDITTQYEAHRIDETAHAAADSTNKVTEAISTEVTTITDA